ncbi:pyridoxal phosphate-dependent aminotransferase [Mobilicoccus pelagius]|uniref:Aminotransferase n=1 Tax=Mobilicoccus pelagius NBRC 104925 TaxID=1089455 RepID=H5USQ8_9MICO|nr:aminotransferase class I/II-fold pyridoxal phosphate-dependent enzyme [Mobilicoccus pelagius]GAB48766.1 putative alanine--oxoisovalerate aminotransferase [Mobilicoccus pelagius NBRC 104925]
MTEIPAPRMSPRLALRGQVEPFHVMEILKAAGRRAATHGDVIPLCVGQPSTPAPRAVREAAARAIEGEVLGYSDALGLSTLRETIAAHYARTYGVAVDPARVAVTTGSSGAFTAVFLAAFEVGDTVLMARPGYPAYRNTLGALGCRVVELDCGEETGFQPTVAMLEEHAREHGAPAGLILASPANPTGTLVPADELAAMTRWCADRGTLLVSDEIYHGITFDEPAHSALESGGDAVVVGSFSKYFSMTGWRVGWAVLPEVYVRPVELLLGNLNICAPAVGQAAAVAAFTPEAIGELDSHVARYARNRDLVVARLPEWGVHRLAPVDGAFYAYVDVSHLTDDSPRWCEDLLDATGVALTPGIDFAPADPRDPRPTDGTRFVRLSFAGDTPTLGEALDRVVAHVTR